MATLNNFLNDSPSSVKELGECSLGIVICLANALESAKSTDLDVFDLRVTVAQFIATLTFFMEESQIVLLNRQAPIECHLTN